MMRRNGSGPIVPSAIHGGGRDATRARPWIVEMQALEMREPDLPVELLPYVLQRLGQSTRSVQMRRIQAEPTRVRTGLGSASRSARNSSNVLPSACRRPPSPRSAGRPPGPRQALGVGARVACQHRPDRRCSCRMRHDPRIPRPQRPARRKRPDALGTHASSASREWISSCRRDTAGSSRRAPTEARRRVPAVGLAPLLGVLVRPGSPWVVSHPGNYIAIGRWPGTQLERLRECLAAVPESAC